MCKCQLEVKKYRENNKIQMELIIYKIQTYQFILHIQLYETVQSAKGKVVVSIIMIKHSA